MSPECMRRFSNFIAPKSIMPFVRSGEVSSMYQYHHFRTYVGRVSPARCPVPRDASHIQAQDNLRSLDHPSQGPLHRLRPTAHARTTLCASTSSSRPRTNPTPPSPTSGVVPRARPAHVQRKAGSTKSSVDSRRAACSHGSQSGVRKYPLTTSEYQY